MIAKLLKKNIAIFTLVFTVILLAFSTWNIQNLGFSYALEDFFPTDDPELQTYKKYKAQFGGDNDFLVVGLPTKNESIFYEKYISNLQTLHNKLSKIKHVEKVQSLINASYPVIGPYGMYQLPAIHPDKPDKWKSDSSMFRTYADFKNILISDSLDASTIYIQIITGLTKEEEKKVYNEIRESVKEQFGENYHLAGRIKAEVEYLSRMKEDMVVFIAISGVLIIVVLLYLYRSLILTAVCLALIGVVTILFLNILILLKIPVDLLLMIIPAILFIVSMSDVIHFINKYQEEVQGGKTKKEALLNTIYGVGLATFYTSITTALGFLTLMLSGVKMIEDFGLFSAIGVLLAYAVTITILPSLILLIPAITKGLGKKSSRFEIKLEPLFSWVLHNRTVIGLSGILLFALTCISFWFIHVDARLIDEVKKGDPIRTDIKYFEDHFSGSRPFDLMVSLEDTATKLFDYKTIQSLEKIHNNILEVYDIQALQSPVTMIKTLNRAYHGGNPEYYKVPNTKSGYNDLKKYIDKLLTASSEFNLWGEDKRVIRFSGKMRDIGSHKMMEKNRYLHDMLDQSIENESINFTVTGSVYLLDKTQFIAVRNLGEGLLIAILIVGLLVGIMFRSLKMTLVTLFINTMPLLITLTIMVLAKIPLNLSTVIIFSIAFGIAVDDTIHLLSRYYLELKKGKGSGWALKRSFLSTGKAIIFTSLVICSGFLVFTTSDFTGPYYTGLLVSISLLVAVIVDLIILPVFIVNKKK